MITGRTVYSLGDINVYDVIESIKKDNCKWEYFVYKTERSPLNISMFPALKCEKGNVALLGVATSRRLARKLAVHIAVKALLLDKDIGKGIDLLFEL